MIIIQPKFLNITHIIVIIVIAHIRCYVSSSNTIDSYPCSIFSIEIWIPLHKHLTRRHSKRDDIQLLKITGLLTELTENIYYII
jgi:hypothetical protein